MGVENGIFWSELGSGFGEPGGTPPPIIPRFTSNPKNSSPPPPPPAPLGLLLNPQSRAWGYEYSTTFLLCNLTYYFADDVQAIWRKYLILF